MGIRGEEMNVGIIGCGLIGKKRADSVGGGNQLTGVCDIDINRAKSLALEKDVSFVTDDYIHLIDKCPLDIVVVSTVNSLLAPITLYAVNHGKHVIVEKPGAIKSSELKPILQAARLNKVIVKVGFNHRYHPAMLKAKEILDGGSTGEIMYIRGRYGHGGRIGYDREWRANPAVSGGGETIDQGVHLIDLARWYMGDFEEAIGFMDTYYWDMPVDDNGFIGLRKKDGRVAWLHVSCTEWKNLFSLEIYCRNAKLAIDGLGGSYGVERLSHYRMLPEMGPPDTTIYEYPRGDQSWKLEMEEFIETITNGGAVVMGGLEDAYEALKIVERINVNSNKENHTS